MNAIRLGLSAVLAILPASASVLSVHPYGLSSPYGVFAMASSGAHSGNGISAVGGSNAGVNAASAQIVTMTGTTPQTANSSYATTTNNTASSFASASIGVIRISSQSVNGDAIPATPTAAYADAGWFETLTATSPGLTGMPGQLTFMFHAEGTLFGGYPRGAARISYAAASNTVSPELFVNIGDSAEPSVLANYSQTILQDHSVVIDFVWGSSFEVLFRAADRVGLGSVFGGLPSGSTGTVNFENTFYYGGLQSITADGSPVSLYTLTSASGVDYRNSLAPASSDVPEPGTLGLCGACLVTALAFKWVRQR